MNQATVEQAMALPWKVYEPRGETFAEDLCLVTDTEPMLEVVGCSEWMRAERGVFEYIVALHNRNLAEGARPT